MTMGRSERSATLLALPGAAGPVRCNVIAPTLGAKPP